MRPTSPSNANGSRTRSAPTAASVPSSPPPWSSLSPPPQPASSPSNNAPAPTSRRTKRWPRQPPPKGRDSTPKQHVADADRNAAEAVTERGRAEQNAREAEQQAAAARAAEEQADLERIRAVALATAAQNPSVAALLAVEAHRLDPSVESLDALHRVLTEIPGYDGLAAGGPYLDAALLSDATMVVASESSLDVWDLEGRATTNTIDHASPGGLADIAPIGDGRIAALDDGRVSTTVYDISTGQVTATVEHGSVVNDISVATTGAPCRCDGQRRGRHLVDRLRHRDHKLRYRYRRRFVRPMASGGRSARGRDQRGGRAALGCRRRSAGLGQSRGRVRHRQPGQSVRRHRSARAASDSPTSPGRSAAACSPSTPATAARRSTEWAYRASTASRLTTWRGRASSPSSCPAG